MPHVPLNALIDSLAVSTTPLPADQSKHADFDNWDPPTFPKLLAPTRALFFHQFFSFDSSVFFALNRVRGSNTLTE